MTEEAKLRILNSTGFSIGVLPIRYLGLPLSSKKWNKVDCYQLVEKITKRITSGYSRQLSYAGRLQIVNVVLFSIYNFWGTVFILPQSVLQEVDKKYREFLWGSSEGHKKIALVAWDKVCVPKKYGGLNIKSCKLWNVAAVGKLLWQLANKKDVLWVKWVHEIYMKDTDNIWENIPPQDCSWYWKKLNVLKTEMLQWYQRGQYVLTPNGTYSMTSSYQAMLGLLHKCPEADLLWSSIMQPRQRFILWLAYQGRLLTKDRLQNMHIQVENAACGLCEQESAETHQHLFTECHWGNTMRKDLANWMGVILLRGTIQQILAWIKSRCWKQLKKEAVAAMYGATIYYTWQARNWRQFRQKHVNTNFIIAQIKKELQVRLERVTESRKARNCQDLIHRICGR
uniref:Non-LTR retroelement reverse transcriptase n=1 Tax=Solanum tuberosum TaxID=4113 RepID=M1B343_SOLTU